MTDGDPLPVPPYLGSGAISGILLESQQLYEVAGFVRHDATHKTVTNG